MSEFLKTCLISKILLNNFRSFSTKKINFSSSQILLFGENGVGKTNILESLTLLGRSPSLRGADFEEMIAKNLNNHSENFSIYAEILHHEFIEKIALLYEKSLKKKTFLINGEHSNNKRQGDLKNHLINFVYLTPQLEQLFILGRSQRRDYLDKIVADLDVKHIARINNYQKLLRERLAILQKFQNHNSQKKWLEIIEQSIVELGIIIASARIEALDFFNKAISSFSSNFPKTNLLVDGDVERAVMKQSSIQIEDFYRNKLEENRIQDLQNFKTNFGVHRSDFGAIFCDKKMLATLCSTGEQKAIMLSITIARAKISASYKNQPTILIFDEIVSHLDEKRKADLFEEISATGLQAFYSATSSDLIPQKYLHQFQLIKI